MIMITMNTMIMIIMTMIYYLAMAPITPPTSSFLNLNLASIRLRREIKSAKTWKKYSITFPHLPIGPKKNGPGAGAGAGAGAELTIDSSSRRASFKKAIVFF